MRQKIFERHIRVRGGDRSVAAREIEVEQHREQHQAQDQTDNEFQSSAPDFEIGLLYHPGCCFELRSSCKTVE
jgi:hypothetical protein